MASPTPCWTYTCYSRAVFQMLLLLSLLNSLVPTPLLSPSSCLLRTLRSLTHPGNSSLTHKRVFSSSAPLVLSPPLLPWLQSFPAIPQFWLMLRDVSLIWSVIRVECLGGADIFPVFPLWLLPFTCMTALSTHAQSSPVHRSGHDVSSRFALLAGSLPTQFPPCTVSSSRCGRAR
jgi:hypothetical protein